MYLQQVSLMVIYALSMAHGMDVKGAPSQGESEQFDLVEHTQSSVSCDDARINCAYRSACGSALRKYMMGCSGLLSDSNPKPTECPTDCQHALIAFTASDEGNDLMHCNCTDHVCQNSKKKLDVCRPSVLKATRNGSVVSCEVAHLICSYDVQCSTALQYYENHCRAMFRGKKCKKKCLNSINILMRQEKAKKLKTCFCNRRNDAECWRIQRHMAELCFNKTLEYNSEHAQSNEIDPSEYNSSSRSLLSATLLSLVLLLKSISGAVAAF